MLTIFATTLPFFALVLAGWLAARLRWLPLDAVPGLNAFVLYFALPAMLFRLGLTLPLGELLQPGVLSVYAITGTVVVAFTLAIARGDGQRMRDAGFDAFATVCPNNGFMGLPLIVAMVGPQAAGPVMCTLIADVFFTTTLCLTLATTEQELDTQPSLDSQGLPQTRPDVSTPAPPDTSAAARLQRALSTTLGNPLPWIIILGATSHGLDLTLPAPLTKLVSMLADAASPVALFTIGTVLRRAQIAVQQDPREAAQRDSRRWHQRLREGLSVGRLALLKLLLHPLLMLVLGLAARQLGAELSALQLSTLVLVAALPTATSVALWSERYRANTARVVHVIMVSTVLAFVSFTLIALALGLTPR